MTTEPSFPAERRPFGFAVHPGTLEDYLEVARRAVASGTPRTVLYHNLHSLYLWHRSAALRRHHENATVLVDGMPVIALLRLAGIPATRDQRVTYVDFIMPLLRLARDESWRVFHVGQSADVQARALERIRAELPGIDIAGRDGYFDQSPGSADNRELVARINARGTDLLLVGFGTPRQEAWLHAHRGAIDAPAVFACGACMEYVAGEVRTPPRWLGRAGLEWSWRLLENPRRFGFRYLVEPLALGAMIAGRAARGALAGRRADRDADRDADRGADRGAAP